MFVINVRESVINESKQGVEVKTFTQRPIFWNFFFEETTRLIKRNGSSEDSFNAANRSKHPQRWG